MFLLAAALRVRKYKESGRREKGIRRCYLSITLPLILILLSYFNFPKQGNYRYQNEPGTMSAAAGGRDWNKAFRYPSPRDLGAEEDWLCWLEQDGGRSYYRSASGKELVSIGGTRVIICFLNDFDPREFPEDGGTVLDKIRALSGNAVVSIP